MTKYVLNSGGLKNQPKLAKDFFAEVLKGLGNHPRILLCFFAQKREDWESRFVNDQVILLNFFPEDVHPIWSLAFPETFENQIKESDAIYIHGGDDHLVQYWLKQFDLPKIWEGKVISTNSASSNALSKYFWTCDWRECFEGIGVLPIKFIAHFESDWGIDDLRGPINWLEGYKNLEEYGDNSLPVYALKEGEFVVLNQ